MRKKFGLFFIVLGILTTILASTQITGFVTASDVSGKIPFLLSLLLIAGGLILTTAHVRIREKGLTEKIGVYDSSHGKSSNHNSTYHLVDPYLNFGRSPITLAEFREGVREIRGDSELFSIVKEEYEPRLQQIVEDGGEKAAVARQFLSILEIEREESNDLSRDAQREIKDAFRDFDGSLTKRQREVLDKYEISYEHSKGRSHWHFTYGNEKLTTSSTASDWRVGRNTARDIIHMLGRRGKKT